MCEIHTCKVLLIRFYWNCHYPSKKCGLKGHIHLAETPNQYERSKNLKNFIYLAKYSFPLPPCSVLSSHILYQTEILGAVALSFFSTATFLHIFSAGHKTRINDSSWLQALLYPSAPPQKPAALLENIIPWTGNWQSVCASGCPSSVSLHCNDCRLFQKGHRWSPAWGRRKELKKMQDTYYLWEGGSYCQLLPCPIVKHLIFIPAVPEWLQEAVQLSTSVRKLIHPMWLPRSCGLPCMPHSAAKPEAPSHTFKHNITQRKISILYWLGHLPWARREYSRDSSVEQAYAPMQNYLEGVTAGLVLSCPPN